MTKLMCWSDAELLFYNGEYLLKECESGIIIFRFYADTQVDAICLGASKYGVYSYFKAQTSFKYEDFLLQ